MPGPISAMVPAAGLGARLAGHEPKQFLRLGDRPILAWSVSALAAAAGVTEVIVGAAEDQLARTREVLADWCPGLEVKVTGGGAHRQDTVRRCLLAARSDAKLIVIHDAARPFVGTDLIERVIAAATTAGAATAALRPSDTIKIVSESAAVSRNLDRDLLWRIQTPQAFRAELIREAHQRAETDGYTGTDDTALVESLGHPVAIVAGHEWNFKITTPADLDLARALVAAGLVRPVGVRGGKEPRV